MSQFCPFCSTEIPDRAVICPNCTRDIRRREEVFGPPRSIQQHYEDRLGRSDDLGWSVTKLVLAAGAMVLLGAPLLPILIVLACPLVVILLTMLAIKAFNTGGRHHC